MNRGFSLLEVLIAAVVLGIAVLSLLAALTGSMTLKEATHEEVAALNAIQLKIAEIHEDARPINGFSTMLTKFLGGASQFEVHGLTPPAGQKAGRVMVVLNEDLNNAGVEGSLTPPEWGLGDAQRLDMNVDGDTNDTFSAGSVADIDIAAIQVSVRWVSVNGDEGSLTRHLLVARK